jgi:uncharacterized protein (DUF362 family)
MEQTMIHTVGVVHGGDKLKAFHELLQQTDFKSHLEQQQIQSNKSRKEFLVAIKPNMMVYVNPKDHHAVVTDKILVESLVDYIQTLGFTNIAVVEAQNDVGRMFKNHNVPFVARQIGYRPDGRYRLVDLTRESVRHRYRYVTASGRLKTWKHTAGRTWRDADYRISFAKCKTHEHDYMTLAVKNIYGCFPDPKKVCQYHIRSEVWEVTGRSFRNFPVHFALVDAWVASDGFQGYKIPSARGLEMLFGGADAVAVDMEVFKRAELNPLKSRILRRVATQLHDGECVYPEYTVIGDQTTKFTDLMPWNNVSDRIVETIDILEEVYVSWAFINMKPAARFIDYSLFPPKNIFSRAGVGISKQLYNIFKACKWYRKLYERKRLGANACY